MQVTKVWWDGDKLMAEPIDPATVYKDNEVAQPDSTCNKTLRAEGKGYPRTCRKCGKGPCIADLVQPEQEQWDAIPDAFNEWWNADYDDTGNPYRKDSPAYWAWSGWKAASKQPEQEPSCKNCRTESACRAKGQDLDVCSFYVPPPAAQQEPDAYGYARRLAEAIWQKHYKAAAPQWKPFDDLMGVLTQIDNMTAGLTTPTAAPVQPVAWQYRDAKDDGTWSAWLGCDKRLTESAWREVRPLYTTPPAAQRQPLTEDQIDDIWNRYCDEMGEASINDAYDIARAIEAANGIGEKK